MDFAILIYKVGVKFDKKIKIKTIEIINYPNITGYSIEEITPQFIEKKLKNKLEELSKDFYTLLEKKYFSFEHSFQGKDNKTYYFRQILAFTKKENDIYFFDGAAINISNEKEYELMCENIKNSPHIGCLIYRNKILQANDYIKKVLETDDRIYEISPVELFPEEIRPEIKKRIQKRLNGQFFSSFHFVEIPSFKNRRRYIEFFSSTIIYQREYAGFAIGIDKTSFYKQKRLLEISTEINKILSKEIYDKKELISEIISSFKKQGFYSEVVFNKELKGYPSSFSLEIKDEDKLFGKINIYSKYNDDFTKCNITILKTIEKDINRKIKSINLSLAQILLKNAIDKSYEWILITDENGKILYINDSVEKISLYKKEEILNKKPNIFLNFSI